MRGRIEGAEAMTGGTAKVLIDVTSPNYHLLVKRGYVRVQRGCAWGYSPLLSHQPQGNPSCPALQKTAI